MKLFLYIGVAGFLGALSRYAVSGWAYSIFGNRFPYGTLTVNVLGSLLLGFVYTLTVDRTVLSPEARTAVAVGFLGSFTTFSTFSLETVNLLTEGSGVLSLANVFFNVLLCLAAVAVGVTLAKQL